MLEHRLLIKNKKNVWRNGSEGFRKFAASVGWRMARSLWWHVMWWSKIKLQKFKVALCELKFTGSVDASMNRPFPIRWDESEGKHNFTFKPAASDKPNKRQINTMGSNMPTVKDHFSKPTSSKSIFMNKEKPKKQSEILLIKYEDRRTCRE